VPAPHRGLLHLTSATTGLATAYTCHLPLPFLAEGTSLTCCLYYIYFCSLLGAVAQDILLCVEGCEDFDLLTPFCYKRLSLSRGRGGGGPSTFFCLYLPFFLLHCPVPLYLHHCLYPLISGFMGHAVSAWDAFRLSHDSARWRRVA